MEVPKQYDFHSEDYWVSRTPTNATLNQTLINPTTTLNPLLHPRRRQRPIKPTSPIHILPVFRLLRLIHSIIIIVPRHLGILRTPESLETHYTRHLRLAILILTAILVLWAILHLHIPPCLPLQLASLALTLSRRVIETTV